MDYIYLSIILLLIIVSIFLFFFYLSFVLPSIHPSIHSFFSSSSSLLLVFSLCFFLLLFLSLSVFLSFFLLSVRPPHSHHVLAHSLFTHSTQLTHSLKLQHSLTQLTQLTQLTRAPGQRSRRSSQEAGSNAKRYYKGRSNTSVLVSTGTKARTTSPRQSREPRRCSRRTRDHSALEAMSGPRAAT